LVVSADSSWWQTSQIAFPGRLLDLNYASLLHFGKFRTACRTACLTLYSRRPGRYRISCWMPGQLPENRHCAISLLTTRLALTQGRHQAASSCSGNPLGFHLPASCVRRNQQPQPFPDTEIACIATQHLLKMSHHKLPSAFYSGSVKAAIWLRT
jgi:hypothetical protein